MNKTIVNVINLFVCLILESRNLPTVHNKESHKTLMRVNELVDHLYVNVFLLICWWRGIVTPAMWIDTHLPQYVSADTELFWWSPGRCLPVTSMILSLPVWMLSLLQWHQLELGLGLSREQHPGWVRDPSPGIRPSVGALCESHLHREGAI